MLLTRTFRKSKLNLKSDRVNLVAPASPVHYKLGLERLTRLGYSNVLRLQVVKNKKTQFFESTPDNWFSSCEINLQHRDTDPNIKITHQVLRPGLI